MHTLILLLMTAALLLPAYGMPGPVRGKHPMVMRNPMPGGPAVRPLFEIFLAHRKELDLSQEQVGALKNIRSLHNKEAAQYNARIIILRNELGGRYEAGRLNYKAIGKKVAEIDAVQSKLRSSYFDAMDKADNILTEEQRGKIKKLLSSGMPGGAVQPEPETKPEPETALPTSESEPAPAADEHQMHE
ncbi:hypothetical protein HZB08_00895 [Candidatus Saganbacteria bacterium]|uniref:Periplasmic heavy metal sensor n=1 Tax=Candidatus Saganbacteria bacterium TaxID=2575572 RepID=A0A9D6UJL4_UNCSA|nr:hypothetical protein [Candidatus Saganbacteria bacterium]